MDAEKQKRLVSAEEEQDISRKMMIWANSFSDDDIPAATINYEFLAADSASMALSTIQGAYITRKFILGGHEAEYQFKIIARIKPGNSNDKRLKCDAMLNRFGDWAMQNPPDLGDGMRVRRMEAVSRSALFARYEDGTEDHQILMKLFLLTPLREGRRVALFQRRPCRRGQVVDLQLRSRYLRAILELHLEGKVQPVQRVLIASQRQGGLP